MNLLLDLFFTFAKVGLFTFGGGYAMIALIEDTCVDRCCRVHAGTNRYQLRDLCRVQTERLCRGADRNNRNGPSLLLHHLCNIEVSGSFP